MEEVRSEALDFAGIGLYRYRFDGTVVWMDRGALRLLDLEDTYPDPEDVVGMSIGELIEYEGPRGLLRSEVRRKGRVRDLRYPFRTLTGKKKWVLHDSYLTRDTTTGEELIQVIFKDITDLREAELHLEEERERLRVTLESIGDGVISTDTSGRVELLNGEAERLTGWSSDEALGRPLPEVFRIIDERTRRPVRSPVDRVLEEGRVVGLANHTLLIARDRSERAIADSGAPILDSGGDIIGVVLVFRDVGSERRAEEARQRAEKLESLGVLAGGIAHDFNNYLTSILGNVSLVRMGLEDEGRSGRALEMLRDAESSTIRARGLTEQLLTFARGGSPVKRMVSLPELLWRCAEFALSGSPVALDLEVPEGLLPVEADSTQLGQVVDNLVINAKQAMPDGGVLRISAGNVSLGAANDLGLPPGDYVRIAFADEGIGIDRRHIRRIFDPYFTTKQRGSGLGLATVYSIVRRHDGHIAVESVPGRGTTFVLHLPAGETEEEPLPEPARGERSGGGRVLVMDDQPEVLRVATRMLEKLGYEPHTARSGEEAVEACREAFEAGRPFDALILDLTVPGGMGGVETLARIRERWPDREIPAIASSGYSTDPVMGEHHAYGFSGSMPKPYEMSQLSSTLAEVID